MCIRKSLEEKPQQIRAKCTVNKKLFSVFYELCIALCCVLGLKEIYQFKIIFLTVSDFFFLQCKLTLN